MPPGASSLMGANPIVVFCLPLYNVMGPAPAGWQVPLCCGARYPLGPSGLATPPQR